MRMTDRFGIGITIGVILIAGVVGVLTLGEVGDQLDERDEELHDRAKTVYGDDYRIVESDECWDLCVNTATTARQQKEDILYVLKRRGGYVSGSELMRSMVGNSLSDEPLHELVKSGVVEKRHDGGWVGETHYKYTGKIEAMEPLPDEEVRNRVHRRLYVTGTSMGADAIANDLPVGKERVKTALQTLEAEGKVDDGYVSTGLFSSHRWIDSRHGTLPDSRFHQYGEVLPAVFVVMSGVVVIGIIQRFRTNAETQA
jgi:hypothetical protein